MKMTVDEMHEAVKLGLDKSNAYALPEFIEQEIDYWLNDAIEIYMAKHVLGSKKNNIDSIVLGLSELLETLYLDVEQYEGHIYRTELPLPDDFKYFAIVRPTITRLQDPYKGKQIKLQAVFTNVQDFENNFSSLINVPYRRTAEYTKVDNRIHIAVDSDTVIENLTLRYYKQPSKIDKAQILSPLGLAGNEVPEFPLFVQKEIISICVTNLLENIESQRQTTNFQIEQMNERR